VHIAVFLYLKNANAETSLMKFFDVCVPVKKKKISLTPLNHENILHSDTG
jgi:hypothetical protein